MPARKDPSSRPAASKKQSRAAQKSSPKSSPKRTASHPPKSKSNTHSAAAKSSRSRGIKAVLLGLLLLSPLYFFDLSRVTTNAMMPALAKGDLVVSWDPKGFPLSLQPGDIALLDLTQNGISTNTPNFLRILAAHSEHVQFSHDAVSIDGKSLARMELTHSAIQRPASEPNVWRETLPNGSYYRIMLPQEVITGWQEGESSLREGEYFVVGDNRTASYDSRHFGPVEAQDIDAKALFVLKSASNDGLVGHWIKLIP